MDWTECIWPFSQQIQWPVPKGAGYQINILAFGIKWTHWNIAELHVFNTAGGREDIISLCNGPLSSCAFEAFGELQEMKLGSN
jgi:hypothetical protein